MKYSTKLVSAILSLALIVPTTSIMVYGSENSATSMGEQRPRGGGGGGGGGQSRGNSGGSRQSSSPSRQSFSSSHQSSSPARQNNTTTSRPSTPARQNNPVRQENRSTPMRQENRTNSGPVRQNQPGNNKVTTPNTPARPNNPGAPNNGRPNNPGAPNNGRPNNPGTPNNGKPNPGTQARPNNPGGPNNGRPNNPGAPNNGKPNPGTPARPNNPGGPNNGRPNNPGAPNNRPNNPGGKPTPGTPGRPGGNPSGPNRPGGGPANPGRPGFGNSHQPPGRPGPSHAPYRPNVPRPHTNFRNPGYRPPRPYGGYWGAPPRNIYRPLFFNPLPPPRPLYINYSLPRLGTILGLTFGTFIDASINTLYAAGYNVLGYANNIVYLGNVRQLGCLWPEVTIYYNDGLMSDTQFQYWTNSPNSSRFDNIYAQIVSTYGAPVSSNTVNGVTTVSWWAGGDTGYITLQYGPGTSDTGLTNYYTTLTYSDYQGI